MKEALEIPTQDWNLFNEPHKKGREGGGCEWRTRDRQTDRHSANTRKRQTDRHSAYLQAASFFGSLPILYSHHDFPSNISPGFYGAFMFSFLCFPSVHFMCVVIDLGSESLAHLSQISKLPSSCSVANRLNIIHKCHKCAQHPHLGPSPSVLCVTLVLTWAKP